MNSEFRILKERNDRLRDEPMSRWEDEPIRGALKMKQLTKIEQLDAQFPGLADHVRNWFARGVTSEQIVALLFEKYQVSLTTSPISSFRNKRGARERERREEARITALVALEVAREEEIKASMVSRPLEPVNRKG